MLEFDDVEKVEATIHQVSQDGASYNYFFTKFFKCQIVKPCDFSILQDSLPTPFHYACREKKLVSQEDSHTAFNGNTTLLTSGVSNRIPYSTTWPALGRISHST